MRRLLQVASVASLLLAASAAAQTLPVEPSQSTPAVAVPASTTGAAAPTSAAVVALPRLSVEEQRLFLEKADIQSVNDTAKGVTKPLKMSLSDGRLAHDALFQRVDISKARAELTSGVEMNFRDYYGYNIAAHQVACLLNRCDLVPAAVERTYKGERGSLVWWVEDVLMDEFDRVKNKVEPPQQWQWVRQQYLCRLFSELVGDADRNQTNMLITKDWRMVMIDFSRAFRSHKEPRPALNTVQAIEEDVFDALRALNRDAIKKAAGRFLTNHEINAMLARRDAIVAHIDGLIAAKGRPQVVYPVVPAAVASATP